MSNQPIDQDQILENLSNQHTWVRLVYMLIYGVMLHVAGLVMWLLCAVQFLCTLVFGKDNQSLRSLSANIVEFIHQALQFVSYNSESRPFPFTGEHQPHGPAPEAEAKAAPAEAETEPTHAEKTEPQTLDNPAQDANNDASDAARPTA
ncbi:DUF4389 domain-containing protein [Simiduia agarivorans]|uniref:Secretion protein HlyD n=1 Tax=Simiduia agarivorans (strain DSM 21679 / JCM 13881 / BCRC 17597 / SA1) TaxID=1117647 RepID=K4KHF1_SIMAS|nr:DUF4389 domain-containing protein [Simiduia agarivorans]AFU98539.1 secretion protein HlyD [Simiduia agarivorans SA1 = DSM 21679]